MSRSTAAGVPGDTVTVALPMTTRLEALPDGSDYYTVLHGPIVLAARTPVFGTEALTFLSDDSRMGHIADGPLCPAEALPVMVAEPDAFLAGLAPVPGKPLTFKSAAVDVAGLGSVELLPFFRLHDSRYTIYWPLAKGVND